MNDPQAKLLGQRLIEFLNLKPLPQTAKEKTASDTRYATDWGSKTVEGLGRSIERMVKEAETTHQSVPNVRDTLIRSADINDH